MDMWSVFRLLANGIFLAYGIIVECAIRAHIAVLKLPSYLSFTIAADDLRLT